MNGSVTPVTSKADGDYTSIDLDLKRGEMLFVVFRHREWIPSPAPFRYKGEQHTALSEPWTLNFPQGWGISEPLTLNELKPWKDLPLSDEGKAFSGTATYETTFTLNEKSRRSRYLLSLGQVEEIAVVSVNGHVTDTLWAEPYETDVTQYLKKGQNKLSVQVTSTWFNRLVYDAGLPKEQRRTWVISGPGKERSLRPSGLLGKVELVEKSF